MRKMCYNFINPKKHPNSMDQKEKFENKRKVMGIIMKAAAIFCNGMIVQANKPFHVFGTGKGSGKITWLGQTKEFLSDGETWCVEFPPAEYGGPYTLTMAFAHETVTITDIIVGEVLLIAGQSNIAFSMGGEASPASIYKDDPLLRTYILDYPGESSPVSPTDGWVAAKCETIPRWSALAYLIGRELREKADHAVGIVVCTRGAATIQTFMPKESVIGTPLDLPKEVLFPDHTLYPFNGYGHLYEVMVSKLLPYTMGKVVWYQGESNTSAAEADIYDELLITFINVWREKFRDPALPFVVVQLADFCEDQRPGWNTVQQKQMEVASRLSDVYTVVCADISESDDIHPRTKWKLAKRICTEIFPKIDN